MIRFFRGVLVIRIYRYNNRQVELCIFPPFKHIPLHVHSNQNIEVQHVYGKTTYRVWKNNEHTSYKATTRNDFLKCFSVRKDTLHGADIGWTGLITLSIQTWIDKKPSSVTQDFKD